MFRFPSAAVLLCAFIFPLTLCAQQSAPRRAACAVDNDPPSPIEVELFREQFTSAESAARLEFQRHTDSPEANELFVRALIGLDRVAEARGQAESFAQKHADSALGQAALAQALLRAGLPDEARAAISAARKLNPCDVRSQVVGARFFQMAGYHKTSSQWASLAHRLRPKDEEAFFLWLSSLPHEQQASELEAHLNLSKMMSPMDRIAALNRIGKLKAPPHPCIVTKKSPRTELPMTHLLDDRHGVGIDMKFNGKGRTLKLDSGASGINLSAGAAKRLNLKPEEEFEVIGVGNHGAAKAYRAHVDHITIGDLELSDCAVDVYENRDGTAEVDGLLGLDTFANFLITVDFFKGKVTLDPLPPRPGEEEGKTSPLSANTDAAVQDASGQTTSTERLFDKVVPPSMTDWDDVFRSGHDLLIPAHLNDGPLRLLVADTGADLSLLTFGAANGAGKISRNYQVEMRGLNGRVDNLSQVDDVELKFNRFKLKKQRFLVSDMTSSSHNSGIEIAGLLGIDILIVLEIRLDYRDNLIKLTYVRH
jgi:hypothetical protein